MRVLGVFLGFSLGLSFAETQDITFRDSTFNQQDWELINFLSEANAGTTSGRQLPSGGDPGSYRGVDITVNGTNGDHFVSVWGFHGNLNAVFDPHSGGIVSLDYIESNKFLGQGAGDGQATGPALKQNGKVYVAGVLVTKVPANWTNANLVGQQASQFVELINLGGSNFIKGSSHPDFSPNGAPIEFGFFRANSARFRYISSFGIDNWAVTIHTAPAKGIFCTVSPVNHFIPFHIPQLHLSKPDMYPNHTLKVLVTSDGVSVKGVAVTIQATQTALSVTPKAPPSLATITATTGDDGQAVFYHNTPSLGPHTRTDFVANGTVGGSPFTCQSTLLTGAGAVTEPVNQFFGPPNGSGFASNARQQMLILRSVLLSDRKLARTLETKPKYRSLTAKILALQSGWWTARDLRLMPELLEEVTRASGLNVKSALAGMNENLHAAAKQSRAGRATSRRSEPNLSGGGAVAGGSDSSRIAIQRDFARLPLSFEPNLGQTDGKVEYMARGRGFDLLLSRSGASLVNKSATARQGTESAMHMWFPGSRSNHRMVGVEQLPARSNYLFGNHPEHWHTNLPQFAQVKYAGIYPGVDVLFHGRQKELEFDFVVAPQARPDQIKLAFRGDVRLEPDPSGGLALHHASGAVQLHKPTVYQEVDGVRKVVDARYVLEAYNRAGFAIGAYDRNRTLVIDPVLSYASLLGGSGDDSGLAITTDAQGNVYVTGATSSPDFPVAGARQPKIAGSASPKVDAFVTKLKSGGGELVYSTYIGGQGADIGMGIAVDSQGNAYVTGDTTSPDFPTANPIQAAFGGGVAPSDAFVLKLDPTGSTLLYSTYLGGSGDDIGRAIAVDSAGSAYVTGQTISDNFPLKNPMQQRHHGLGDAFVAKLNPSGAGLVYSTFLGGVQLDIANAIAIDTSGNAYVAGLTYSVDFPIQNALQPSTGGSDAFVAKLDATGSSLLYSTYLGGTSDDIGTGVAVDSSGNAYVTGVTGSPNYPLKNPIQPVFGAKDGFGSDAFVTKLDSSGRNLIYSTFLGGSGTDAGLAIAAGSDGSAFVAGETDSTDFPSTDPSKSGGTTDAFLVKLNAAGSQAVYSTLIGGTGNESATAIALDPAGGALYVTGATTSGDFPATSGAFQTTKRGRTNALVMKVVEQAPVQKLSTVSAASFNPGDVAAEAIVSGFAATVGMGTEFASAVPLPTELAGASLLVKDSQGKEQSAALFFVSPGQVNYLIPSGVANGPATVSVMRGGSVVASGALNIAAVAPGLFSANADGHGVAAASSVQVGADGSQKIQPIYQCGTIAGSCKAVPIDLGDGKTPILLTYFGTGVRGRSDLAKVTASLGGVQVPVVYAGPQGDSIGLDQVNVGPLPTTLRGRGEVSLVLTVDGKQANAVTVSIK